MHVACRTKINCLLDANILYNLKYPSKKRWYVNPRPDVLQLYSWATIKVTVGVRR